MMKFLKRLKWRRGFLITDDKDFGELIFRLRKPSSGVILMRTSTAEPSKRFMILEKVLKSVDVKGKLWL